MKLSYCSDFKVVYTSSPESPEMKSSTPVKVKCGGLYARRLAFAGREEPVKKRDV